MTDPGTIFLAGWIVGAIVTGFLALYFNRR